MDEDNPEKMILLRKYSAIYGRFDSKRKNEGKMSLHEVSLQVVVRAWIDNSVQAINRH